MHRRLTAPLGGEEAHCLIGVFAEAQQVADDTPVKEGAVFVGVGEVGRLQVEVAELVEYVARRFQLLVGGGADVEDKQDWLP